MITSPTQHKFFSYEQQFQYPSQTTQAHFTNNKLRIVVKKKKEKVWNEPWKEQKKLKNPNTSPSRNTTSWMSQPVTPYMFKTE